MSERSKILCDRLRDAVAFFERVLATPHDDVQRTAAIKSFEFSVELSWRLIKSLLADEGIESLSPKDAIRRAGDAGLIVSPERWLGYVDLRNETSHTYTEKLAETVYAQFDDQLTDDLHALLERASASP